MYLSRWLAAVLAILLTVSFAHAAEPPKPGLFVAVGYGGFRGWSADGEHWTADRWSDKNADDPNIIFSLTYKNGVFLCSGGGVGKGFILRSTDGKHWDEVASDKWRITGVLTMKDKFLSVFREHFQTSDDGLKWEDGAEAKPVTEDKVGGGFFRRWATDGHTVVFAGDYDLSNGKPRVGWLGYTRDGQTPLTVHKTPADICGLAFGAGRFVACQTDGAILTSADGKTFEKVDAAAKCDYDNLLFHEGDFYLRDQKSTLSSHDGLQWTRVDKPRRIPRAVAPEGVAVGFGWGGIDVATDGKNWKKAVVPIDPTGICAVVYAVPRD